MSTSVRTTLLAAVVVLVAGVVVSGGSESDPRTPPALPAKPPPFLGVAVLGSGEATAAVDAYGDVVDLRPTSAGPALIHNSLDRQAAQSVPADTGIVPWVRAGGRWLPPWKAESVDQRFRAGGTTLLTQLRYREGVLLQIADVLDGQTLARVLRISAAQDETPELELGIHVEGGHRCGTERGGPRTLVLVCAAGGSGARPPEGELGSLATTAQRRDEGTTRRWLHNRRALGRAAPTWAQRLYVRSLLVLRSLLDRRTGALAAGARDGWAYVWPRDAATGAIALASAGYRPQARRIVRFLDRLDLSAAARFDGDGSPVPGRGPQGDAAGWVAAAARTVGQPGPSMHLGWRDLPDYQEGVPGDYLANAISARDSTTVAHLFDTSSGLVRSARDPASGLDSAAAWAIRPFAQPALYGTARKTMLQLADASTRYGVTPGEGWEGGEDPWSAPTAWTAWSLASLAREQHGGAASRDRRAALRLLAELRRGATPLDLLPERVDANTGVPASTTPLAWSHAFAILALRELWP